MTEDDTDDYEEYEEDSEESTEETSPYVEMTYKSVKVKDGSKPEVKIVCMMVISVWI